MPQRLIILLLLVCYTQFLYAQNDFAVVKKRVIAEMLRSPVKDDRIAEIAEEMEPDRSWADINYVDLSNTGYEHANHLRRVLSLSVGIKL